VAIPEIPLLVSCSNSFIIAAMLVLSVDVITSHLIL